MDFQLKLTIENWFAWSPGLETMSDWKRWAAQKHPASTLMLTESEVPNAFIPTMIRRRLSLLTTMALYVSTRCTENQCIDMALFASQHGELQRNYTLLKNIAMQEDVSPSAFSQSVHNAAVGFFSILRNDTTAMSSLAAGGNTFLAACVEASAYLQLNPTANVLLVCFDEPIPSFYARFDDGLPVRYACAFILSRRRSINALSCVMCDECAANEAPTIGEMPQALRFLQWWLGSEQTLSLGQMKWSK